jgi:hypothetical protein
MREIASGISDWSGQQNVRRRIAARAFQLAQHASHVWIFNAALEQATCLHHLVSRIMDSGCLVMQSSDERELVGLFREAWEYLTDLHAGDVGLYRTIGSPNLGRCAGLHIERVELAWTAHEEQEDAVHVGSRIDRSSGLKCEEVG